MEFSCDKCGKKFGSETALKQHKFAKHPEVMQKETPKEVKILTWRKRQFKTISIFVISILILVGIGYAIFLFTGSSKYANIGPVGSTHQHATIRVFLDGRQVDFSQLQYQLRSQHVHFEGGDGDTIHKHATGVTLGFTFETLGIKFDENCFILETGKSYCNGEKGTLKFYINGNQTTASDFANHEIFDNEKYLISFGNENVSEIQKQLAAVPNVATTTNLGIR